MWEKQVLWDTVGLLVVFFDAVLLVCAFNLNVDYGEGLRNAVSIVLLSVFSSSASAGFEVLSAPELFEVSSESKIQRMLAYLSFVAALVSLLAAFTCLVLMNGGIDLEFANTGVTWHMLSFSFIVLLLPRVVLRITVLAQSLRAIGRDSSKPAWDLLVRKVSGWRLFKWSLMSGRWFR